ncbi:hypothetical protein A21D_01574 [Virgibacillus dokdonensis]|uniref:Uncharacterized protein n=1 Tax=Virgibacillus dokdonensis TaxID=302167 RepID=A0A2K9IYX2_9BACI|nr:hypothetical protein A21D_01574 [Virgibacillus dokdonensis]
MDQKLIAEVYRLGLLIHFFTVEEVIHWVDHYIEKNGYILFSGISFKSTPRKNSSNRRAVCLTSSLFLILFTFSLHNAIQQID